MFSNQHRQEVKEANPELTMVEIAKKLGEMWRGMEQDVRKEWEEKATSAKDHYMVGFACVQPALSGRGEGHLGQGSLHGGLCLRAARLVWPRGGLRCGGNCSCACAQDEKKLWLEQRQAVQAGAYGEQ